MTFLNGSREISDDLSHAGGFIAGLVGTACEVSPQRRAFGAARSFAAAPEPIGEPAKAARSLARPEGGTLASQEPYSQAVARLFNLPKAQTVTTTTLKSAQLAITRLSSAHGVGPSAPMPVEKAYMVCLQLQDALGNDLWREGRPTGDDPFVAGSIVIANLEDEPIFNHRRGFDCLLMHIPQIAFDELSNHHGARHISQLTDEAGTLDPIVLHLVRALLPCFEAEGRLPRLFFDHVVFAIHSHLAARYGRLTEDAGRRAGGLTVWQERIAKEALAADLGEETSIANVAEACGLPIGRFVRAFRLTTGMPPHRWLRAFRVERAKDLLLNSTMALAQIAYDCGFADQSHFTRVFTVAVGTSPGAWRRGRCG